jgi:hypothetical protein
MRLTQQGLRALAKLAESLHAVSSPFGFRAGATDTPPTRGHLDAKNGSLATTTKLAIHSSLHLWVSTAAFGSQWRPFLLRLTR